MCDTVTIINIIMSFVLITIFINRSLQCFEKNVLTDKILPGIEFVYTYLEIFCR